MKILSKILNIAAAKGIFGYHPKCKNIALTHLSFADNLLIFCKGNLESIAGIIFVLNHFYDLSGLKLNVSKTELYAVGISSRNLEIIKCTSGFNQGFLSVRQFILYQTVINRIDQLCSRLLWKRTDQATIGARVSWAKLCCPKSERGLGLKNIKSWNTTCTIQLIRNILAREGSLWVAWLKCYIFKNDNFRDMAKSTSHSWSIKKLLKPRTTALHVLNAGTKTANDV
ncbi:uncharacterized protein LOC120131265 [Hibiscus syriacus]|uniref:uncharacterized protein LOC120131265 n=1 Tax=Hibiscus syriacus TaxID=106335 RepID=UPI00192281C9|nr:uncharacterized protein LOC120131265 [Hibiscus syriacus]